QQVRNQDGGDSPQEQRCRSPMGDNRDVRQGEDCQERTELVRNAGSRKRERDEPLNLPWVAALAPRGRKGQREPKQQRYPGDRSVPLFVGDEDLASGDRFCVSGPRECRFGLVVTFCAHRRLPPWTTRVETGTSGVSPTNRY